MSRIVPRRRSLPSHARYGPKSSGVATWRGSRCNSGMKLRPLLAAAWIVAAVAAAVAAEEPAKELGVFEASADVGDVGRAGSATFDAKEKRYLVSGGGENMWAAVDAFHF